MTAPTTTDPYSAAKPYHHGDLRRALLNAADVVLERCGPEALSLRAVAREAGVSPAAPYHHFKDKDDLVLAVAREGFARLRAALDKARIEAEAGPAPAKTSGLGLAYIAFAQAHPALYRVMYDCARREDAFPDDASDGESGFLLVKQSMKEMGGPELSETDVLLAAIAGWCTVHGLAEMSGFAQFRALKEQLGGEEAFLRGVLEHVNMISSLRSGAS
jgi:AcrR family transcriptional regulator